MPARQYLIKSGICALNYSQIHYTRFPFGAARPAAVRPLIRLTVIGIRTGFARFHPNFYSYRSFATWESSSSRSMLPIA